MEHLTALSCLLVASMGAAQSPPTSRMVAPHLAADLVAQIHAQESLRAEASVASLLARRLEFGLDADASLDPAKVHTDELGQTHTHVQQFYRGVKVWGGQAITHMDRYGTLQATTSALKAGINLDVLPSLPTDEALALAHQDLAPEGPYTMEPTTELVILPVMTQVHVRPGSDATAYEQQVLRYALAYHLHTSLQNGADETKQMDYLVDARSGAILQKWFSLQTGAAVGTGHSSYSGTVSLNTNSTASGYELRDMTRGTGGTFGNNVVTDLNHGTSGNGAIYTDSDNTWGYVYGVGGLEQNDAVDVAYGLQVTWDLYKNVLGRNGIDGTGKATYSRVNYGNNFQNAFWDDGCFCMTYGESWTALDVAGHEMSHGVIAKSVPGGLIYKGESGGLNESNSDIFGTMVEFYAQGGGEATQANTIPDKGGNWTHDEQLLPTPTRYLYKPSLDGASPNAWNDTIGSLDVHYSSGPGNRMFYFLSQGASISGDTSTYLLPNGMTGIGNDYATRIHYRATTAYYLSTETYAQAREAHLSAAADLFTTSSPEYAAVQNAFHGINVGVAGLDIGITVESPTFNLTPSYLGEAYSSTFIATEPISHTFTWSATNLPPGIINDAATGHYGGTFTQAGQYSVGLIATDELGRTGSGTVTWQVIDGVAVDATNNTSSTVGQSFSGAFTTRGVAQTWSATHLPPGIQLTPSIDGHSCAYSGILTQAGTYQVTYTATSATGKTSTGAFTWTVTTPVAVTSVANATDIVGTSVHRQFAATNGKTPYTWSASGLPNGISLDSATGTYGGVLTQANAFHVAYTVTDAIGGTSTGSFDWTVSPSTAPAPLAMAPFSLSGDSVGDLAQYTVAPFVSGGTSPYTYTATGLPLGIQLNSTTGALTGTFTQNGSFGTTITVTDHSGAHVSRSFSWVVYS